MKRLNIMEHIEIFEGFTTEIVIILYFYWSYQVRRMGNDL